MDGLLDLECRGVRQRKKQTDPTCCPVCGITIRPTEVEQHYALELERLQKISTNNNKLKKFVNTSPNSLFGSGGGGATGGNSSTSNGIQPSTSSQHQHHNINHLSTASTNGTDGKNCWNTFQKIKNNRQSRLKAKTRKRKADDPLCPVCNKRISEDLNEHVEFCLRRSEHIGNGVSYSGGDNDSDDDDSIDIVGESFEEYEWAGQTRIRASSLLDGGYSTAGLGTSISNTSQLNDEDEDLNVDGDDSQLYGSTQYSEHDIILPLEDNEKKENENLYLRKLVIGQEQQPQQQSNSNQNIYQSQSTSGNTCAPENTSNEQHSTNQNNNSNANGNNNNNNEDWSTAATASSTNTTINYNNNSNNNNNNNNNNDNDNSNSNTNSNNNSNTNKFNGTSTIIKNNNEIANKNQIIESLKLKIREYDSQIKNKSKCLICMDEFRDPVVSICCWHVHCEECWLRTLGAVKLCPQCKMITSPTDLRRIYM